MAIPQDTSLNGLREQITKSIHGRLLGFCQGNAGTTSPHEFIVGPKDIRVQVSGMSSAGSTITSTSVTNNIDPFGITLVGATGASATTAYTLAAPIPGVRKVLFNATTGSVTFLTTGTGGAAFICSSASVTSTHGSITLNGKGCAAELLGLTTALWGVLSPPGGFSSVTTAYTFV